MSGEAIPRMDSAETSPATEKAVSPEGRFTEQSLRDRYEGSYRQHQAETLWTERQRIREEERNRSEKIQTEVAEKSQYYADTIKRFDEQTLNNTKYHKNLLDELATEAKKIEEEKKQRGFFKKMKYRFLEDPLVQKEKDVRTSEARYKNEMERIMQLARTKKDQLAEMQRNSLRYTIDRLKGVVQPEIKEKTVDLREKVKRVNRESRQSVQNTLEALNQGDLNIEKLARETNSIVVHTIPLDGWSMKNTSMNNEEVDTLSLSAHDKSQLILDKRPDLSASVIQVGETIPGQDMFYPFGYILDGKIIAAYRGDEGTVTKGNARMRKGQYHGTLQKDTVEQFKKIAVSAATESMAGKYSEAIVHDPNVKGILIDEQKLSMRPDLGDTQKKIFILDDESQRNEYNELLGRLSKESVIRKLEGVPTSGENSGRHIAVTEWKRTGVEKSIDYAREHHPDLPIYLRRSDGVYDLHGQKVDAAQIYS